MNFLSPWFLLGALAVAAPIAFHLIRRTIKERTPFSSLMFLRPTPPRTTRRRKLEHLGLLLLRCLCLLLLAAAFARPFFSSSNALPPYADERRQTLLLVDTSASMKREGLWATAQNVAAKYLAKAKSGDEVSIVTFDRQPATIVSFSEWTAWSSDQRAALARQRLAAMTPSWMSTQLGLALTTAAERFVDDTAKGAAGHREIVLISDLQEGAKLDGLQGHDWPSGVAVIVERLDAKPQANAGLEMASETSGFATANAARVRVLNVRDSGREKFQLSWEAQNGNPLGEPEEIYLPSGQTRVFDAPTNSTGIVATRLRLSGDEVDFDNLSYFSAPEVDQVKIAWLGSESANDPAGLRYYFQRAFPATPRRKIEIVSPLGQSNAPAELLNQATFAVIPGGLAADQVDAVHAWLSHGRSALLILTNGQMGPMLAALASVPEVQLTEAAGDYALLGRIDFTHPLFAPFADPRFSDFSHIHFWKHRRVEFPAAAKVRVLAQFDDGSPALAQIPVGQGNLLVLASGWNPSDSQLSVSSKFPPLMQTLLDWTGTSTATRFQYSTGDAIPSPWTAGILPASSEPSPPAGKMPAVPVQWQKPDGKTETLAASQPFTSTDQPGIYTATFGDQQRHFAVNLSLDESRTAPMSPDELARLGVPLQTTGEFPVAQTPERLRHLQQAEQENHQKLWRWVIAVVLVVTLAEIIFSGRLARRVKTEEAPA